MYNVKSNKAEEFIDDQEILETIAYAKENKDNRELIFSLIERAKDCKGLTHREAMLLLECEIPEAIDEMEKVAKMIKQGYTYATIEEESGASTATISRVKRSLQWGNDAYTMILDRLNIETKA